MDALPITDGSTAAFNVPPDTMLGASLNRHQRRALAAAGYYRESNGMSHERLTKPAYNLLVSQLASYDNTLSTGHQAALMALVGLMTEMAQGVLRGRWAFGLPTGMGKTTAIIAWSASLVAAGLDHVSVAVACSKVEALCQMKRDMIALGVPAERIGLIHSYRDASEPSTEDADRQIMLVTHARVRDGDKLAQFSHYKGKARDLMLYDESLVTTGNFALTAGLESVLERGSITDDLARQIGSPLGNEADQVQAHVAQVQAAFEKQATDHVGGKVLEWARTSKLDSLKAAAREQVNNGRLDGYADLSHQYMNALPTIDPNLILSSPDAEARGVRKERDGSITLDIPGVGRTEWKAAIRAGFIGPRFAGKGVSRS